ncbi:MAG: coenzyme F420-0:L-glutamate ligase [Cyanobacteriota bacterium]
MCKKLKYGAVLGLLGLAGFELIYRTRETKGIEIFKEHKITWDKVSDNDSEQVFLSKVFFRNYSTKYQLTLVKFEIESKILFKTKFYDDIKLDVSLTPKVEHVREDGYLHAFLMDEMSNFETEVKASFSGNLERLKEVHAVVVKIKFQTYERTGLHNKEKDLILVPYQEELKQSYSELQEAGAKIYPVKTHLLSESDDIAEVIKKYAGDFIKPGDVVVMAESPVAITQGRFKQPVNVKPSFLSKRLCYFVPSAGSLSSPFGMESALEQIGAVKFIYALIGGTIMKLLKKPGWFYTLAGIESELIDDLTGTIAPYDKYIVLGPANPQEVVDDLKNRLDVDFAIADANDLKKARILASTLDDSSKIRQWLLNNPAGNSAEQTPIVIIRPDKTDEK